MFIYAREKVPCIVFLDEKIDAIRGKRTSDSSDRGTEDIDGASESAWRIQRLGGRQGDDGYKQTGHMYILMLLGQSFMTFVSYYEGQFHQDTNWIQCSDWSWNRLQIRGSSARAELNNKIKQMGELFPQSQQFVGSYTRNVASVLQANQALPRTNLLAQSVTTHPATWQTTLEQAESQLAQTEALILQFQRWIAGQSAKSAPLPSTSWLQVDKTLLDGAWRLMFSK